MTVSLAVNPASVTVGGSFVIAGSGFGSRRTVSVYSNGAFVFSFRATRAGTFSRTMTSEPPIGPHVIKATDTLGRTASATVTVNAVVVEPPPTTAYTFEDDFPGTALNRAKWGSNYKPSGLPRTQMDPTLVRLPGDGYLHLRAEKRADGLWYSSSVDTKLTFRQRYGIYSARIKVPMGKGLWPAGPWGYDDATGQEIDGMEILANPSGTYDANHEVQCLHCTVHWSGASADQNGSAIATGIDLSAAFHEYAFEWRADKLVWTFDGRIVKTITNPAQIPTVALPVILDLGVSGWAGLTDATTPSPSEMLVDWVRVRS